MLQALERQPIDSPTGSDERTTIQSPAPTANHQQRDIYVRNGTSVLFFFRRSISVLVVN